MSDITGIFSGKNELAKFLAIGGLAVIVFSFYYPLEKSKDFSLRKIELDYQKKLYSAQRSDLQETYDNAIAEMVRINKQASKQYVSRAEKETLIEKVKILKKEKQDKDLKLKMKGFEIQKLREQLKIAENYEANYTIYFVISIIVGIAMTVAGFISWAISGVSEHRRNGTSNPTPATSAHP